MRLMLVLCLVFFLAVPALAADRKVDVTAKDITEASIDERSIALVIGNSDYLGIASLRNPVNDARDMAAAHRYGNDIGDRYGNSGFRITRMLP